MKTKTILISIVILATLLVSACDFATLPAPVTTASPAAQPAPRSLTVSGAGKVTMKPDIAYIYMGVHTENPGAAEAVAENNTNTQKLIEALKAAGVDTNDIQTSNFSIYQNSQIGPDGKTTGTNYAVDNTVNLTVRGLAKLGDLLDTAVKAGANNINSIQFDLADKTQALSQARDMAVKNTKTQAGELASSAGVQLGDIQSIEYSDMTPSPFLMGKGMGGGGGGASLAVPINPGQMDITVTVTMTFEIK
jgi:uncharacterized protein YggE